MTNAFVLADDLSGALEASAPFRRAGWRVVVPIGPPEALAPAEDAVFALSTESRNLPPDEAAAAIGRALASPLARRGRLLYKKIDSTLRGALGAEIEALRGAFPGRRVYFCPANPAAGRIVRDGRLLVQGVPLEQTEFARDPLAPARGGTLAEVLSQQGVPGDAVVCCEAETLTDVRHAVSAALAERPPALLVGSGALGAALAERSPGCAAPAVLPRVDRALIVCGSRHPASHAQLEHLARSGIAPIVELDSGGEAPADLARIALARSRSPVVAVRFGAATCDAEPRVLTRWIASLVADLARAGLLDPLLVTGGETAAAVCARLGGRSLEILTEFAPGVVATQLARSGAPDLPVVIKPGGFGGPVAWQNVLETIMKQS
jgi:uncharacterized protein YgbK (DUF1537 family)